MFDLCEHGKYAGEPCEPCSRKALASLPPVRSEPMLAAGDLLAEHTGSCPRDLYGWEHPETCEKHCDHDTPPICWVEYVKFIAANAEAHASATKEQRA